jgi:hypothetical protein
MKLIIFIFLFFYFYSCGYKSITNVNLYNFPLVYIEIKSNKYYIDENYISKNKIKEFLRIKYNIKSTNNKKKALSYISLEVKDIKLKTIAYKNNFASSYRAYVNVMFTYKINKMSKSQTINITDKYDFTLNNKSIYSQLQKDKKIIAIQEAVLISIEKFIYTLSTL